VSSDILVHLSQFGAAGLIGVLWILERRWAAARTRELTEAHERLMRRDREADALIDVIKENTRAITALEAAQQRLVELLRSLASHDGPRAPAAG